MTYTPGSQLTAMDPNAAMIGASSSVVVHVQEVSGSPLDVPVKVKLVSRNQMSEQDQARALDIGNLGRDDYSANAKNGSRGSMGWPVASTLWKCPRRGFKRRMTR